jgi:hypothetical protein
MYDVRADSAMRKSWGAHNAGARICGERLPELCNFSQAPVQVAESVTERGPFAMTFDKSDFQTKFAAVVKDKGLLHINPTKINTSEEAWAFYNDVKKQAHAELNQGCSMHLQGKEDGARRCFAYVAPFHHFIFVTSCAATVGSSAASATGSFNTSSRIPAQPTLRQMQLTRT